jgi:hypothetical protein
LARLKVTIHKFITSHPPPSPPLPPLVPPSPSAPALVGVPPSPPPVPHFSVPCRSPLPSFSHQSPPAPVLPPPAPPLPSLVVIAGSGPSVVGSTLPYPVAIGSRTSATGSTSPAFDQRVVLSRQDRHLRWSHAGLRCRALVLPAPAPVLLPLGCYQICPRLLIIHVVLLPFGVVGDILTTWPVARHTGRPTPIWLHWRHSRHPAGRSAPIFPPHCMAANVLSCYCSLAAASVATGPGTPLVATGSTLGRGLFELLVAGAAHLVCRSISLPRLWPAPVSSHLGANSQRHHHRCELGFAAHCRRSH